jgi:two-component system chemotaxis sensor kinase CheA
MKENFRAAFIEEALELLIELEYSLLELEKESNANDTNLIAKVFRALHTIKGSSGMFGYNEIALFIHDIESAYEHIRNGEIKITPEIIGLTLSAKDSIGEMLSNKDKKNFANDQNTNDILTAFRAIIQDYNSKNGIETNDHKEKSKKQIELKDSSNSDFTYHIRFQPLQDYFLNGANPVLLLNELRRMGSSNIIGNVDSITGLNLTDPSKCYINWDIILTTAHGIDAINEVFIFVDETMCTFEVTLLDEHDELNNKSAHKLLGQLLISKHIISKEDIADIIGKVKQINNDPSYEILPGFKKLEKLKDKYRKTGLSGLAEEIKDIIAEINEFILKSEGDPENQEYLYNISRLLWSVVDISEYMGLNNLAEIARKLEKLIICFIDKPVNIDSETVEVFIQGIDYLNEILENILDSTPIENNKDFIAIIDNIISGHNDDSESADMADTVDSDDLIKFLDGKIELLKILKECVENYEKLDSGSNKNEILRIVHSINSDSVYAGLNKLANYTNILDNFLGKLCKGEIKSTSEITNIISKAAGTINNVIEGLANDDCNILKNQDIKILNDLVYNFENKIDSTLDKIDECLDNTHPKIDAFLNQVNQYKEMILFTMKDTNLDGGNSKVLERLLNNLENAAKYIKHKELIKRVLQTKETLKTGEQVEIQKSIRSLIKFLSALINGEIPIEASEVNSTGSKDVNTQNIIIRSNKSASEEEVYHTNEKPKTAVEVENKSMRVDEYKIDNFSNMIGELVIARNSYEYLLSEVFSQNKIEQSTEKKLNDNLHLLSRLTNDLQVGVTTLRMVPLKSTFQKYSRVVRDISKKQNKIIDFVTLGNETEVDKKTADSLSDPLIHLIRNSCDHGIELPEERVKLGKPETGTILLKASIEGGKLIIVMKDDGKGLDRKRIYEKAQKMGIDTTNYDDNSILDLIFKPGFSTKAEASELSGRGVGMDVVKTTLDKLGGSINVKTEENIGTEITFVIPMSIGLSDSLIVEAKGETYALPIQSVIKTLKLEPAQFSRLHDRLMFNHRGEVIPAATLVELLNGKSEGVDNQLITLKENIINNNIDEIPVVIIQTKKGNYGIIVDKLKKNIELSIKPVPESIAKSNVISGVSILGDGNVVLVLNPEKLV